MATEIVRKSLDGTALKAEKIVQLFRIPLFSRESAMILSAAREKSERASNSLAEVHAQVGLNVAPCPNNCMFCAFAAKNKVFMEPFELPAEAAVNQARWLEEEGANAILVRRQGPKANGE